MSILFLSFMATSAGLIAPFFQKLFIDKIASPQGFSSSSRFHFLFQNLNFEIEIFHAILGAVFFLFISQIFFQLVNFLGIHEALVAQKKIAQHLYSKVLNLKKNAWGNLTTGEMISFYTTDVPGATLFLEQTLPQGASVLFPLVLSPLALSIFFHIPIWQTSTVIFLVSALNIYLGLKQSRYFYFFKSLSSERVGLVNEWIQNIYFLKVLNLVSLFEKKIFEVRDRETQNRFRMTRNGQVMNSISSTITFFINIIGLITLIFFSQRELTAGDLLAMTWILGVFLVKPFRQLPWLFTFAFDAWSSVKRLDEFFEFLKQDSTPLKEFSAPAAPPATTSSKDSNAIFIRNMNLQIGEYKILNSLSFQVHQGEFVAIVGEVGSGKSSLVYSLIGEAPAKYDSYLINNKPFSGLTTNELSQTFTLVPQEGFILSASLRENVAFRYETPSRTDQEIYAALNLAEFHLDAERFQEGLNTRIGERGLDLSGGQKQRISLARAHFLNADIILLDDALSALDSVTEKKITKNLLLGSWKNKTRLLITHRLDILPQVDRILFLLGGQVEAYAPLDVLLKESSKFRDFMKTTLEKQTATGPALKEEGVL